MELVALHREVFTCVNLDTDTQSDNRDPTPQEIITHLRTHITTLEEAMKSAITQINDKENAYVSQIIV